MKARLVAVWSFPEVFDREVGDLLGTARSKDRLAELVEKTKNVPNRRFKIDGVFYDELPEEIEFEEGVAVH